MAGQSSNLLETVDHLRTIDQLTGRFLLSMAAELRILDDAFDLMKLETGWFDLEIEEVDLKHMLERVMTTVSNYMAITYGLVERNRKSVKPQLIYTIPKLLPKLKLDEVRIERILTEALLGAVQISRNRESKIAFSVECNKGWLHFEINDDGVGLPEYLINQPPALPATSQVIIDLHGGKLEIKNQAGGGWVMNLTLPVHQNCN